MKIFVGIDTVSYTHLDVYKRQPYHTEIMEAFNGIDLDSARKVAGNGFYYLMGDIARLHSAVDVYKRQMLTVLLRASSVFNSFSIFLTP